VTPPSPTAVGALTPISPQSPILLAEQRLPVVSGGRAWRGVDEMRRMVNGIAL
jgi:hypothetical protein